MNHKTGEENFTTPNVSNNNNNGVIISDSWCNTQSTKIKFNYTWTIDNFSFYGCETGEIIKSSCFSARSNKKIVWCLEMYPKGDTQECFHYLSLFVKLVECNVPVIRAKIEFSILNNKGEKTNILCLDEPEKFTAGESWGSQIFIERYDLKKERESLTPDDKLTLFCEIVAVYETINTSGFCTLTKIRMPSLTLGDDIGDILDSGQFHDCIFKVGDKTIKVHKNILGSRSSVFNAMFSNGLSESQSNIVEIKDFRYEVVKEMLNYIYRDSVSNLGEMTVEILAIAEKYNLIRLKAMAEQSLCDTLTTENIFEILKTSEIHSAEGLRKYCLEFICNNAPEIINKPHWDTFVYQYPEIIGSLYRNLLKSYGNSTIDDPPKMKRIKISNFSK